MIPTIKNFIKLYFFCSYLATTKTDNKCEKFWHKLFMYPGHNLREGLKCLDYDGNITSMQALGNTSTLQHVHFDVESYNIIEINEVKEYGVWRNIWRTTWKEERLKWPSECQKEENGPPDFVESELLDLLWNGLKVLSDVTNTDPPKCQKTFQISQVRYYYTHCPLVTSIYTTFK